MQEEVRASVARHDTRQDSSRALQVAWENKRLRTVRNDSPLATRTLRYG
jgi:hypothetical protein